MASIFDNMPDFQAFNQNFRNQTGLGTPQVSSSDFTRIPISGASYNSNPLINYDSQNPMTFSGEPSSIYNTRTPFLQRVNYNTPTMSDSSTMDSTSTTTNSTGNGGNGGFWSWNGLTDNPITHALSAAGDFVSHKWDQLEQATDLPWRLQGAISGLENTNPAQVQPGQDDGTYLGAYKSMGEGLWNATKALTQNAYQGFTHPDQAIQQNNQNTQQMLQQFDPVTRIGLSLENSMGRDPVSLLPIGDVAKVAGLPSMLRYGADLAKGTVKDGQAYQEAANAIKNASQEAASATSEGINIGDHVNPTNGTGDLISDASAAPGAWFQAPVKQGLPTALQMNAGPYAAYGWQSKIGAPIAERLNAMAPNGITGLKQTLNFAANNPVTQAVQRAFIKDLGADPRLVQGKQQLQGALASDALAIEQHYRDLAAQHGLTPDEIHQLPEVFEAKGSDNPKLQKAYEDLHNSLINSVNLPDGFKIGTNAENTTLLNGKPILDPERMIKDIGYYPQRYSKDVNAAQLDEAIAKSKGFSTTGPFNQERLFRTVAEAEGNGFYPERNAYAALAQRSLESSKSLRTAAFLQNMIDSGVISKKAMPGMVASTVKPVDSFFTVTERAPTGTGPANIARNESGAVFKPLTKLSDQGYSLPKELMRSAPRYRSNPLNFTSDMDKAAYIIGNTTNRSARDDDFVKSLMDHTGLSEPELRTYGQYMRGQVRSAANGVADGEKIEIPRTLGNLPDHSANSNLPNNQFATHIIHPNSYGGGTPVKLTDHGNGMFSYISEDGKMRGTSSADRFVPIQQATAGEASHLDDSNNFASLARELEQSNPSERIVKVNPFYMRPEDMAAIKEHLDPSRPTGLFAAADKLNDLYNKAFLLNPMPHMHNIYANGVGLGGAKTSYIKEAFDALRSGKADPWYQRSVKAGAVSSLRNGTMMDAIKNASVPQGKNVLKRMLGAAHDFLWNNDAAIRTALFRDGVERGMSDAEAAAHTNKYMVDYNNLTPFEKKYVKPVVGFYNWKKGNIPLQLTQMVNQTPKYVAYDRAKNAVSNEISGQTTDANGRILSGIKLPDGSQIALDAYSPMDEIGKIADKGLGAWAYNSLNPIVREGISQAVSLAGAAGLPFKSQYPIYKPGQPVDYNIRKGIAHVVNALDPISDSVLAGQAMNGVHSVFPQVSPDIQQATNQAFGLPHKDKEGITGTESIAKLLGGFTARDNPARDLQNQQYQNRDNILNQIQYMKETGQPVSKAMKRAAYRKIH